MCVYYTIPDGWGLGIDLAKVHWYDIPGADHRLEPSKAMGGSFIDLAAPLDTAGGLLKDMNRNEKGQWARMDFAVFELPCSGDWGTRCHRCPTSVSCRSVMASRVVMLAPIRSPLLPF